MKSVLKIILITSFILLFLVSSIALGNFDPSILLDGAEIETDAPPQMINDRILVPVRFVAEAMGAEVAWDEDTQTAVIEKGKKEIRLVIDGEVYINGESSSIDVPASIIGGRTMVPIRFVSETLDCTVEWDPENQRVIITTEKKEAEAEVDAEELENLEIPGLSEAINKAVSWYQKENNLPGQEFWEAYTALWGAGENLNDAAKWETGQYWRGNGPKLDPNRRGNEHIRYSFMLLSIEKDPTDVWGGRNLLAELAAQQNDDGSFGHLGRHVWAVELLNIGKELGLDVGAWKNKEARQRAVDWLLAEQKEDGSFDLFGAKLDATGWALITLSYSRGYAGVDKAIDGALDFLEARQKEDPGTADFSGGQWADHNTNSLACVISGLVALGEDLTSSSSRWVRNGGTVLDALLQYQHKDGYFMWSKDDQGNIDMATHQSLIALLDIKHGKYTRHRMVEEIVFNK